METSRALTPSLPRVSRLLAATALGLSLAAAPALAAEDPAADEELEVVEGSVESADAGQEEGASDKIQLAETPRDRVGLLMYGFLGAVTIGGVITAVRQLKGSRPQASGEFRWR